MENRSELAFEKSSVIQELNKVEGFNPLDFVTSSVNDRNENYINLETKYRQLWFRLRYPNGKVTKKILRLTDQVAAVEARVYLDRSDSEENYVASGVAQRFFDANKDFGLYYLESAETIAEGRALGKAGFGIQFCDFDGQKDDVMPDTGIKIPNNPGSAQKSADRQQNMPEKETPKTNKPAEQSKAVETSVKETADPEELTYDVPESGQTEIADAPNKAEAAESKADSPKYSGESKATEVLDSTQQSIATETAKVADTQPDNSGAAYDDSTPVEDILKVMTVDEAEKVVITVGFNRGKTLRQVSLANFRQLRWFFESYNGDNNILKAGAKLLYERSQQQQKAS